MDRQIVNVDVVVFDNSEINVEFNFWLKLFFIRKLSCSPYIIIGIYYRQKTEDKQKSKYYIQIRLIIQAVHTKFHLFVWTITRQEEGC